MIKKILLLTTFILATGIPTTGIGAVPDLIPIQGVLSDDQGTPIDGLVDLGVTIYDASVEGNSLWSDIIESVDVENGFFTAYLGSNIQLHLSSLLDNSELWLGISVDQDPEMDRIRLAAVPFAVKAQVCEQVGALTEEDINNNFMSSSYVPDWGDIANIPVDIADGDDGFTTEVQLTSLLDDNYLAGDYTPAWSEITGIPAGFVDGVDDNTTYTAGEGLLLTNTEFSVDYAGLGGDYGTAESGSRSDHSHDDAYIQNQKASEQVADLRISGSAEVGSMIINGNVRLEGGVLRVMSCPNGMTKVVDNLCVENEPRSPKAYWMNAMNDCRKDGFHVCTFSEWDTVLCNLNGDGVVYNPNGMWMGNYVGNNQVLCGDKDITGTTCVNGIEGECNKSLGEGRQYYCCHSMGAGQ